MYTRKPTCISHWYGRTGTIFDKQEDIREINVSDDARANRKSEIALHQFVSKRNYTGIDRRGATDSFSRICDTHKTTLIS